MSKSFIRMGSQRRDSVEALQPHKVLCIYHANCADGFGAAWAMHHNMPLADIEFYAGDYKDKEPPDVTGRIVYMLDFSYKRSVVEKMIATAETFLVIDHHKSALEELWGLDDDPSRPNDYADVSQYYQTKPYMSNKGHILIDMNRSGALLSWDYFSKGKKPPKLIEHIDDRDRWQFKLSDTRDIQAALFSYPYNLTVWDSLMITDPKRLAEEGSHIERKHFKDVTELLEQTKRTMIIGGFTVPVANLPYTMASDAAHILAKGQPFAACYFDTPAGRSFSLRSNGGEDVSLIAKEYGGGGHRNAAGFLRPIGWEGDGDTGRALL